MAFILVGCSKPVGEVVIVNSVNREMAVIELLNRLVSDVGQHPKSAEIRGRLAMAYDVNGFQSAAIQTYQQASEIDQDQFAWWYFKAILLARKGETQKALAAIERALSIDDRYIAAWLSSAQWHLDLREYKAAEEAYQRAAALGGEIVAVSSGLANVYLLTNRPEKGLLILRQLSNGANLPSVQRILGRIYTQLGQEAEAKNAFDRGKSDLGYRWLDPLQGRKNEFNVSYGGRLEQVQQYLNKGRAESAISLLMKLAEEGHESTFQSRLEGAAYLQNKRYSTAGRILRSAVAKYPENFELRLALANFHREVNDLPGAITQLRIAKNLVPHRGQTYLLLATILSQQGKKDAALFELDKALQQGVNKPADAMYTAGMVEVSRSAWVSAAGWFNKALELDPAMTMAYVSLSLSMAELNLFEEAVGTLKKAQKIGTHFPEIENAFANVREMESGIR